MVVVELAAAAIGVLRGNARLRRACTGLAPSPFWIRSIAWRAGHAAAGRRRLVVVPGVRHAPDLALGALRRAAGRVEAGGAVFAGVDRVRLAAELARGTRKTEEILDRGEWDEARRANAPAGAPLAHVFTANLPTSDERQKRSMTTRDRVPRQTVRARDQVGQPKQRPPAPPERYPGSEQRLEMKIWFSWAFTLAT